MFILLSVLKNGTDKGYKNPEQCENYSGSPQHVNPENENKLDKVCYCVNHGRCLPAFNLITNPILARLKAKIFS
jgi:hypothetical protein